MEESSSVRGLEENVIEELAELQGLVKDLNESQDEEEMGSLSDNILQLLKQLPSPSITSSSTNQIYGSSITLWNKAVLLKPSSQVSLSLNAQLRHVALSLLLYSTTLDTSDTVIKKQIMMAIKTGRSWLESDNPMMAETSLELAKQCYNKLINDHPDVAKSPEYLKLHFKILCSQAEASLGTERNEEAFDYIKEAKEALSPSDREEMGYLSMLCYNSGLILYQCNKYNNAVAWLKESYDMGRSSNVGAIRQSRTLRLLANSYLEWNGSIYWQKALNAVGLANSEHSHPAGLLLKLDILLQFSPQRDRISTALNDTISHPDITTDIAMTSIKLTSQYKQQELALSGLHSLKQKFKSPDDQQSFNQLHLELLFENGLHDGAKELVEDCIEEHFSSNPLSSKSLQQLHLLLWEQAAKSFERKDYTSSLQWYQYSLTLFPNTEPHDPNIAKLHRNICTCYIELHELDKAMDTISSSLTTQNMSAHSYYLAFKVSVLLNNEPEALNYLHNMMECIKDEDLPGLTAMAAQLAFESHNRELAVHALEGVVRTSSNKQQVFTSLRCLVRLQLTFLKNDSSNKVKILESVLNYFEIAHQHFIDSISTGSTNSTSSTSSSSEGCANEIQWFIKISWNTALECQQYYNEMRQAFDYCQKFSSLLTSSDNSTKSRCKTCHLMSAASGLQAAKQTNQQDNKVNILKSVLSHVQKCRELCGDVTDPSLSLLCVYEFETQLILDMPDATNILKTLHALPKVDPKVYETIAALAIKTPPKDGGAELIKKSLNSAINIYKSSVPIDLDRLSRCTHSLLQVTLGQQYSHDATSNDEAFKIIIDALDLMKTKGKYPEMELVWHMIKAWNTGIYLYSGLRYDDCEKWCSTAIKFLPLLEESTQQSYKDKMMSIYSDVLSKMTRNSTINL